MNADILAMLGGAGIHGGSSSRRENEAKSILEFKAGKMSTSLKPVRHKKNIWILLFV